jgi:hypothetical protein
MMMAIAVVAAVLAVLAGVLQAAFDLPQADADPGIQRSSLVLVIATSVTTAVGVTYALFD